MSSIRRPQHVDHGGQLVRIKPDAKVPKKSKKIDLIWPRPLPSATSYFLNRKSTCERKEQSAQEREFSIPNPCTW